MNVAIITVNLPDGGLSSSAFLAKELALYGANPLCCFSAEDDAQWEAALTAATEQTDVCLILGGGDAMQYAHVKRLLADSLSMPLALQEPVRATLSASGGDAAEEAAWLPEGCQVLPAGDGVAPGMVVTRYEQDYILLPAFALSPTALFDHLIYPYLQKHQSAEESAVTHVVGLFGMAEAEIRRRLSDMLTLTDPALSLFPTKDGETALRLTARGDDAAAAEALCQATIAAIRTRLGRAVYGVDKGSLQQTVVALLKEKNKKISTAESCTAGMVSGRLTEVPGASSVFECGVASYSNEIKHDMLGVSTDTLDTFGAVSVETAREMAVGACRVSGADIGISITGVAGPNPSEGKPVGTVFIALADAKRVWVRQMPEDPEETDREAIRARAASFALNMARRYLEALPGVMAGGERWQEEPVVPETAAADIFPPREEPAKESRTLFGKRLHWTRKKTGLAVVALLCVAALLIGYFVWFKPLHNSKQYTDLQSIYASGEVSRSDVAFPEGMLTQFQSLYAANRDVRGWVRIDNTNVNYPVMGTGKYAGYYGEHDFYGKTSAYGVPYFTDTSAIGNGSQSRSLVIYGNGAADGQMFSQLTNYNKLSFLKNHALIEMNTIYRNAKWKIFGVMIVSTLDIHKENFDFSRTSFSNEADFTAYIGDIRARSLFTTGVDVRPSDALLMLTTTTDDYDFAGARIVVAARRVRGGETGENDLSHAAKNQQVVMPTIWQQMHSVTTTETTTTTEATATTTATTGTSALTTTTTVRKTTATKRPTASDVDKNGNQIVLPDADDTETTKPVGTTGTTDDSSDNAPTTPQGGNVTAALSGKIKETEYMPFVRLENTNKEGAYHDPAENADGVLIPTNKDELQRLLFYVVKMELGSASLMKKSTEAQKAQAVASYSYLLNYCKSGATYKMAFKSLNLNDATDKKLFDAVGEVTGVKIINTQKSTLPASFCSTLYFTSSCGVTANSEHVWSSALPYCRSVVSKYDTAAFVSKYGGTFEKTMTITLKDFYQCLKSWSAAKAYQMPEAEFTVEAGRMPLYALSFDGGTGNYVYKTNFYYCKTDSDEKIYLTGKQIRDIWDAYKPDGQVSMRSHCFNVTSYEPATGVMKLSVKGYGHGVGMSQYGAVGYANEEGWSYIQILSHYYSITKTSACQIVLPVF